MGYVPKLHVSSTGACAVIRILFRKSAARCIGNIRGPNISSNRSKLHAGWYADRFCPGGSSAVPSDAERFLLWPLRGPGVFFVGLNFRLEGKSIRESVSLSFEGS